MILYNTKFKDSVGRGLISSKLARTLGICLFFATGCSSAPVQPSRPQDAVIAALEKKGAPVEQEILATDAALQADAESDESEESDSETVDAGVAIESELKTAAPKPHIASIPVEINKNVEKWIDYFTGKDRERFHQFLKRGAAFRNVVQDILAENGVPPELYYLAMIESGYVNHAASPANALGVWQFIRATGKRYGLHSDSYVDERRDPIRATEAAAKYLKDLHNVFQSWYLAMAAYNAGERRILNAIFKGKTRNFWSLVEKKALPRETMEYVPKFLAAVIVGTHAEKYGFTDLDQDQYPDLETVEVPTAVRIADIANASGVPPSELALVNPHLKRGMTPPGRGRYEIWVPKSRLAAVKRAAPFMVKSQIRGLQVAQAAEQDRTSSSVNRHYTLVKRGETLAQIARKNRVSVRYLKRINGLESNQIQVGQRLRMDAREIAHDSFQRYRVRRGDSLGAIARRFGVSVEAIKRANRIRKNRIFAGQVLRIAGGTI